MVEQRKALTAIGLMSGTSMDGIDIAVLTTDGDRVTGFGPAATYPYDDADRQRLRAGMVEAASLPATPDLPADFQALGQLVAERHGAAVRRFMSEHGLEPSAIAVVGFHGQTLRHAPGQGLTWQAGDGQRLADDTGLTVVADFRSADVAAGGEGAPLAPLYHGALVQTAGANLARPVAVLNIGGVANVTWVGADGLLAFDTGPGNALIDDWVARHDAGSHDVDGRLARAGQVDEARIGDWLQAAYFRRQPPKSLDRDAFAGCVVEDLGLADGAATLTAFTAATVAAARAHMPAPPALWLVCGGGRHNGALLNHLRARLGAPVEPVEVAGWRGDALEAEAFAFLAVRALQGLALSLPTTTGVARPLSGGRVFQPK